MQPSVTLNIGAARLCFQGQEGLCIEPPGWDYPDFIERQAGTPGNADIAVQVCSGPTPECLPMATRFDTGDAWRLSARGPLRRIEMIPRNGDTTPHWCAETDDAYARVQVYCADKLLQRNPAGTRVRHLVQYPLDQILLVHHLAGAGKGLLLHAAGAVLNTGAQAHGVVFAGISGAGKSTLTRQLRKTPDWCFFSDDRIVVRLDSTPAQLHGTPWPGDAHVARNRCAPLKSLCFLCQSDRSALVPLAPAAALERLLPVASIPWFDRALLQRALDCCERLLAEVPAFELHFQRRDPRLAQILAALPDEC